MQNIILRRRFLVFVLLVFVCLFAVLPAGAQKTVMPERFKTEGIIAGFGTRFPTYEYYKVCFLAADLSWSFKKPKKNDFLSLYVEPQFNPTATVHGADMEFGCNAGIRNYVKINSGLYFYQMLGSGPHYISAKLESQASGFIFSDNLFLGVMKRIHHNNFLNVQVGIRHISNASLKMPNKGMNTFNIRVGFSKRRS